MVQPDRYTLACIADITASLLLQTEHLSLHIKNAPSAVGECQCMSHASKASKQSDDQRGARL